MSAPSVSLKCLVMNTSAVSRLLAKDGVRNRKYPGLLENGTVEMWEDYARKSVQTNNYALRVLSGTATAGGTKGRKRDGRCCDGERTDRKHLERAKALVRRFTFVLDIDCLDAGMEAVADILGIERNLELTSREKRHLRQVNNHTKYYEHPPSQDRIPYRHVYDYLVRKNALDIELYKWSKSISLVNCSAIRERNFLVPQSTSQQASGTLQ